MHAKAEHSLAQAGGQYPISAMMQQKEARKAIRVRPSSVPVIVLTGFLGSGKTTVLNHILQAQGSPRVAVLVNDFGSINIDAKLIVNIEGEVISLANGCICCTIRGDLYESVTRLLNQGAELDAILIEASGISNPAEIALTFINTDLSARTKMDCILGVIDAEEILDLDHRSLQLAREQIEVADIIAINKTDLVTPGKLLEVQHWIQKNAPQTRIIETTFGRIPAPLLFGNLHQPYEAAKLRKSKEHIHDDDDLSHHGFETILLQENEPLSLTAVQQMLVNSPGTIFRAKGFLYTADMPQEKLVLQMAGKRISVRSGGAWDKAPASEVVLIGVEGGFDPYELQAGWENCRASRHARTEAHKWLDAALQWLRKK